MKIATPLILKKVTPLFPSNPPLKVEVLPNPLPLLFENFVGGSTPHSRNGRGGGGMLTMMSIFHGKVSDVLGHQRVVAFLL